MSENVAEENEKLKRLVRYIRACVEELASSPLTRVNVTIWSHLEGALEEAESLIEGPTEG